jgi:hypothetical protein
MRTIITGKLLNPKRTVFSMFKTNRFESRRAHHLHKILIVIALGPGDRYPLVCVVVYPFRAETTQRHVLITPSGTLCCIMASWHNNNFSI